MRTSLDPADPATTLAGAALLLPPVAVLMPLGIAPLAGATAALVLLQLHSRSRLWPEIDRGALIAVLAFALWGCATAWWSLLPDRSVSTSLRTAIICSGGLVLFAAAQGLDTRQRALVGRAIAGGAIIAGMLLIGFLAIDFARTRLIEDATFLPSPVERNRAASVVAILGWPLALLAARRWRIAGLAGALTAVAIVLIQFQPAAPIIAFVAGGLTFAIGLWSARAAAIAVITGMLAIALLAPGAPMLATRIDAALTAHEFNENSISHRLGIWAFSSTRALERPLTGWGLATSRAVPGGNENLLIRGEPNNDAPSIPLHPHNATIQIWLEAGAPALLLVLLVTARALWAISRRCVERRDAATLLAMSTTLIAIANMSYGIWQGWWLCTIWLSLALGQSTMTMARRG